MTAMLLNPAELNSRGMLALSRHEPEAAAEYFTQALKLDPGAAALWMNLATARRAAADDTGERAALEGALTCDQRHLMANVRLAELHERLGEARSAHMRWAGVVQMTSGVSDKPEMSALAERARRAVAGYSSDLAVALGSRLDGRLMSASETEKRRFQACRDIALGKRRVFFNQPEGIHYPYLPADEFFDRSHFPWFSELEARSEAIRIELEALIARRHPGFGPYVEQAKGTPRNKWSNLDSSLDWTALYLWKYGEPQTEILAACPETAAALEVVPLARIPGRGPSVFFSILRAQSAIPPHTGVTNVRAIVHLPLIVPPDCGFRVGGETREWQVGEAFAFDDTIEHEAWNRSDRPRAVLICDVWNPHLSVNEQGLLRDFFEITEDFGRPDA